MNMVAVQPMTKKPEKSLLSILSTLIVISQWSLGFIVVSAPLTVLGAPFLPLQFGSDPSDIDAKTPTFFVGLVLDEGMTRPAYFLEALIVMVFGAAALFGLHHLRRILRNVAVGRAFARENGLRLRKVGYAAMAAQLVVYALWIISITLDVTGVMDFEGRTITLTPMPWIGILGVFVLSTIFLEGAQIKEEQDLTV